MANELVAQFNISDCFREQSTGYNPWARAVPVGDACGVRLHKLDTEGYVLRGTVAAGYTLDTGLTVAVEVALADMPDFHDDVGKVVRLGVTFKRIITGESLDMDAGAGVENTLDVTLQATAGLVTVATLAVALADLDSLAAGERFAMRVRRIGSATQDTCKGSAVLTLLDLTNTVAPTPTPTPSPSPSRLR